MVKELQREVKNIQNKEYRTLPHNLEAEQAIIGAILVNNELINKVNEFLSWEHFYEPVHQRIYKTMVNFMDRGLSATPVTLKNHFDKDQTLTDIGGAEYLIRLAAGAGAVINLKSFGTIIYDLHIRRSLINIGYDIVNDGFEISEDSLAGEQLEIAEQKLFNLGAQGFSDSGFKELKHSLANAIISAERAHKLKDKVSGIACDFRDLDNLTGGLQNSDLLILAGRPSMGKTAFAINLAVNACKNLYERALADNIDIPSVGFFSLEMSSEQLAARMISMESGVDSSRMRRGMLDDTEFGRIIEANKKLYKMPFYMDDTPALSIGALRTRARRLKRTQNLALVIVDYLQLLRSNTKKSESNRVQEVSEITQGLKAIAKELNIPVIALSQLSRAVEQREDKRPQLSDLRESGSIEQDADIVMFIYREEYYISRSEPPQGSPKYAQWQQQMNDCHNLTEIIIAKQRNGPIGTAKLFFNAHTTKFENLDKMHDDDNRY